MKYGRQFEVKNDAEGREFIKQYRKLVAEQMNLSLEPNERARVVLYGRLGKNNPNAVKYRTSRSYVPYSRIRLEDANTIAVYLMLFEKKTIKWRDEPERKYWSRSAKNYK